MSNPLRVQLSGPLLVFAAGFLGGIGRDRHAGGEGNDRIDTTASGNRDNVDCGPGRDRANADRRDHLTRCERVSRSN
jgi:hypothetical protein